MTVRLFFVFVFLNEYDFRPKDVMLRLFHI